MDGLNSEEMYMSRFVVRRPFISALMMMLTFQSIILPDKPDAISLMLVVLWIIPVIYIIHGIVMKELRWFVLLIAALWIMATWERLVLSPDGSTRYINMLLSITVIFCMYWFARNKDNLKDHSGSHSILYRFLRAMSGIFILLCFFSLGADIIGYVFLAKLVTSGVVISIIAWLILASVFLMLNSLFVVFLETDFANKIKIIQRSKDEIRIGANNIFRVSIFLIWIYSALNLFLLWHPAIDGIKVIMSFGYTVNDITFSIGDLFDFIFTIFISWVIGRTLKVLLEVEILGRFDLPRGIPMAIGSLSQYTLITIGIFVALSSVGFGMDKIGLIFGALGVGIGFGLQNVVGNFISGLILIFERPITIGDVIEVEGVMGTVTSIGIRSSRVTQFNGKEEIIPNANLISNRVTNLTLSDSNRRYIISLNTDTDYDPDKILKILEDTINNVEGVLKYPAPRAYFEGIRDQSLQFVIYYWLSENILDVNSAANLAIFEALRAEGVKVHVPRQRYVNEEPEKPKSKRRTSSKKTPPKKEE